MVYRLMNERASDQEIFLTDDYILAVAVAGAAEHWLGNTQVARYHVQAVKKLLELRGGLKSVRDVTYPLGLMAVKIFVEQGFEGSWRSKEDLRNKVTSLSQWIRDVQVWNFSLSGLKLTQLDGSATIPHLTLTMNMIQHARLPTTKINVLELSPQEPHCSTTLTCHKADWAICNACSN